MRRVRLPIVNLFTEGVSFGFLECSVDDMSDVHEISVCYSDLHRSVSSDRL